MGKNDFKSRNQGNQNAPKNFQVPSFKKADPAREAPKPVAKPVEEVIEAPAVAVPEEVTAIEPETVDAIVEATETESAQEPEVEAVVEPEVVSEPEPETLVVVDAEDEIAEEEEDEVVVIVPEPEPEPVIKAVTEPEPAPVVEEEKSFFQKPALFPTRFNNTSKTVVAGVNEDNCIGQAALLGSVADKVLRTIGTQRIVRVYGSLRTRDQRAVIVSPEVWAQIDTSAFRVVPQPVSWFTHVMAHSLSDARVFNAGTVYAVCTKSAKAAGLATAKIVSFDAPLAYVISGLDFESLI